MVLSRAAALPKGLGRTVLRRAGSSTRNRSWRQVGRRGYASEHGHQEGSEIPWMIGSAAVTIPAAAWLLQQGPKKSDHSHGDSHEEHAEGAEQGGGEEEESQEQDSKDDSKEEDKQDSSEDTDESEDESSDDGKSNDSGSEDTQSKGKESDDGEYEAPGANAPKQINWTSASNKGPGEGQKGERKPSQKKGEKDSQGDFSGAKHPYIDDPEKSKKGIGVTETARIHGTVDPSKGARGVKDSGSSSE